MLSSKGRQYLLVVRVAIETRLPQTWAWMWHGIRHRCVSTRHHSSVQTWRVPNDRPKFYALFLSRASSADLNNVHTQLPTYNRSRKNCPDVTSVIIMRSQTVHEPPFINTVDIAASLPDIFQVTLGAAVQRTSGLIWCGGGSGQRKEARWKWHNGP